MLTIPNTTTTASDEDAGAAVFPADAAGALTPYSSGFLFVANQSAFVSIKRGPTAGQAAWSPYALVSPTLVPISSDRAGRNNPDYIFGVKAVDGVAGTHAQVFGALFQAGEAGFVPSAQFGGTISPSGGFTPAPAALNFQHNEIVVATEPTADFDDSDVTWQLTDDAPNTRMKIAGIISAIGRALTINVGLSRLESLIINAGVPGTALPPSIVLNEADGTVTTQRNWALANNFWSTGNLSVSVGTAVGKDPLSPTGADRIQVVSMESNGLVQMPYGLAGGGLLEGATGNTQELYVQRTHFGDPRVHMESNEVAADGSGNATISFAIPYTFGQHSVTDTTNSDPRTATHKTAGSLSSITVNAQVIGVGGISGAPITMIVSGI